MGDHARLAPSKAHRWMPCPGSVAACEGLPETSNTYARRGSFGHSVAAKVLIEDIDRVSTLLGWTDTVEGETFVLDQEAADAIQEYVDVVRSIAVLGGELRVEKKTTLSKDLWGTYDAAVWAINKRSLDVVDLKLGAGNFVAATNNVQLLIYAIGLIKEAGLAPRQLDEVRLHIVQPLYASEETHRTWTISGAELGEFMVVLFQAVIATEQPNAPLVAGSHCQWCPAAPTCPALARGAMQTAQDLFPTLEPAQPVAASIDLLESMPPERLAAILNNLDIVEGWCKAIREHAHERATRGETIPGFKLVGKLGNREWKDGIDIAATLANYGVDAWAPRKLLSPAGVEKLSKGLKPVVAELVTRSVTSVSLVRDSDPRPALSAPVEDFPLLPQPNQSS